VKRDDIDLHAVRHEHLAIHERAMNWARYVRDGNRSGHGTAPMFRHYRSSEVWGTDTLRTPIDTLDGHRMEKAVAQLPEKHRDAIRWSYVYVWIQPAKACRGLGVTRSGLADLVHDARSMLKNRGGV
jgi:DNA-directed RNA polymerase specialized sigma24 family protein